MVGMEGSAGPQGGGAQTAAQPQYTKRRQFLFFKIRSKPIYGQKAKRRWPTLIEWIISLAMAVIVAVFMKPYGASITTALVAGAVVYFIFFGIFSMVEAGKTRKESIKSSIEAGTLNQRAAAPPGRQKVEKVHKVERPRQLPKEEKIAGGPIATYANKVATSRKNLEMELREVGIKKSPADFVKGMMAYAIVIALVVAATLGVLFNFLHTQLVITVLLAGVSGLAFYMVAFNKFMMYPAQRSKVLGKQVERDILFAARDMVIAMRSGMPLYNAITAVSTGYGAASRQFGKIIELVQLGMPIGQAMDDVSSKSESRTFKMLMLQASVSIEAGVDVADTLQEVVDQIMEERVIDLRRYGQKLNALAMFYMLFGVIFPSMGIAVVTIMSTFISIFPITYMVLILALVFIVFIQLVLLNIMRNSRPVFVL